jgi:hypothetical protein
MGLSGWCMVVGHVVPGSDGRRAQQSILAGDKDINWIIAKIKPLLVNKKEYVVQALSVFSPGAFPKWVELRLVG